MDFLQGPEVIRLFSAQFMLILGFVLAHANCWFSHAVAHVCLHDLFFPPIDGQ